MFNVLNEPLTEPQQLELDQRENRGAVPVSRDWLTLTDRRTVRR
jgi:hypothetical protein